jgi:hypothetical protein
MANGFVTHDASPSKEVAFQHPRRFRRLPASGIGHVAASHEKKQNAGVGYLRIQVRTSSDRR